MTQSYRGWSLYSHLKMQFTPSRSEISVPDSNGMRLNLRLLGNGILKLVSPPYGMSNLNGEDPSGNHDPRNMRVSFSDNQNKVTVHTSNGTVRFYYKKGWTSSVDLLYLLEKEILPNGKVIKYQYDKTAKLIYVESLDPQERFVYASLRMEGSSIEGGCHFISSSGQNIDYRYYRQPISVRIKEKRFKAKWDSLCPAVLSSVSSPLYREETLKYREDLLLSSYSGRKNIFKSNYAAFGGENSHYRVSQLLLPVGEGDVFVPVYDFSYDPPVAGEKEGTTQVKNRDGTSVTYNFSKNLLIKSIHYFGQDQRLKKEKIFTWNDKQWLKAVEVRDSDKKILYRKSYEYDRFGNPILEVFTGNLSGEEDLESFTTKRLFSDEGRNLLLREETEDGKVLSFSYLPDTNLVISKLTKNGDQIILREFSLYDDCHNLVQKISDDGSSEDKDDLSGITQRTLKTYTLRQSAPFLHMPEWEEEAYLEAGLKKILRKVHFIYDLHGNVAQEEVYNADEKHVYTLYRTYNERGDVLTETNRFGQEASYAYDSRGHLIASTNFSHKLSKTLHYDTKGRLKEKVEQGEDGILHKNSSEYDFQDRKIQDKDLFQNRTSYTYDPLAGKVAKAEFPSILSAEGDEIVLVSTHSSYDPFGREVSKTDANGNVMRFLYNSYGSPLEIIHPNGSKEIFRYAKNNTLLSYTNLEGHTTRYERDILGRVISKTYLLGQANSGKPFAKELFTYSGFHLLSEIDKEGNLKKYTYDGAGRKIREELYEQVSEFNYDALGYLTTLCRHNEDNTLLIHYKRDLEGRILEERKTDASLNTLYKIHYSYDLDGNQQSITRFIQDKEAKDTFVYDSFSRLIEHTDAAGSITSTTYHENFVNILNQKVLQIAITDPHHIKTLETRNALGRVVSTQVMDPSCKTLSYQEQAHDPVGNLLIQTDHLYNGDQFQGTQTFCYTYTSCNQIATLTRGYGSSQPRITSYTYTPSGKISTKTLPSGVTLAYTYSPLGSLSSLSSSDNQIHHTFEHNFLGFLLLAKDEKQGHSIERSVDPFGNVLFEKFPSGLEVTKKYDALGRLTSLKMGNEGEVLYTYDPLFLRGVTRLNSKGVPLYTHTYEKYDTNGNLVLESLPQSLGAIAYAIDLRGQKTSMSSSYFSEECAYDALGNLVRNESDHLDHFYSYDNLSQLSSEKSSHHAISYLHDSLYNRISKNGTSNEVNVLNELTSAEETQYAYDLNGNLILKQTPAGTLAFNYDPLNRLVEASSLEKKIIFTYDPLGRRLTKVIYEKNSDEWEKTTDEHYLYQGQNEIGAFTPNQEVKNLRVLGYAVHKNNPTTVGVELEGKWYVPLLDLQGNVCRLIDPSSKDVISSVDFTAFGERLRSFPAQLQSPWGYASKRFDPELELVYFGKRYYDPECGRWLTLDPAGYVDSANLYQYVFNNPFRYVDPEGEFAFMLPLLMWGAELVLPSLSAYATPLIYGAITGAVAYGGYKALEALNKNEDSGNRHAEDYAAYCAKFEAECEEAERKKYNTNPFDGPVGEDVVVVDEAGNAIKVPPGNWLTGTKDGKWIQVRNEDGTFTEERKDGGGHPRENDVRGREPHGHVPGVFNSDGTPWLPIKK